MPYIPIANLTRRGEKIGPYITLQNAIGMVLGLIPTWLVLANAPGGIRTALAVAAALVGYVVTFEWNGLSLFERGLWYVRGSVRTLLQPGPITPTDLPVGRETARVAALRRGGDVRLRPVAPPVAQRPALLARPRAAAPVVGGEDETTTVAAAV